MSKMSDVHNEQVGPMLRRMIAPIIANGGDTTDILVLTESLVTGVVEFCAKNDSLARDLVFDKLIDGVRGRLDRLAGMSDADPPK